MPRTVEQKRKALTPRGVATKLRIVEAAARLIYRSGAERVSLEEVMEASGASKSQLYHYFADKDDLLQEVIVLQASRVVAANGAHLERIESFADLRAWRDDMVAGNEAAGNIGGCPLGSLVNELSTQSEKTRNLLERSLQTWSAVIEDGLVRMQALGRIAQHADTKAIAIAVLAAIQGGLLLSKAAGSSKPLELAFDMAFGHIRRYAVSGVDLG